MGLNDKSLMNSYFYQVTGTTGKKPTSINQKRENRISIMQMKWSNLGSKIGLTFPVPRCNAVSNPTKEIQSSSTPIFQHKDKVSPGTKNAYYCTDISLGWHFQPIKLDEKEVMSWTIVTREELQPIYELLPDEELKNKIDFILKTSMPTIPVHRPFKLRNLATNNYLCWQANRDAGKKGHFMEKSDMLFGTLPIAAMNAANSQYLWNFSWSGYPTTAPHPLAALDLHQSPENYESLEIRSGREVYLHPSCKTLKPFSDQWIETQTMFLSKEKQKKKENGEVVSAFELSKNEDRTISGTSQASGSIISVRRSWTRATMDRRAARVGLQYG